VVGGSGGILLHRDGHVAHVPVCRLGDLADRIGKGQQPGAGQLVHLADVAVVGERGHRHVGDVVGIDERLELVGRRHTTSPPRTASNR